MIHSLRKKFILFAMAAVTVLLLVLLVSINGLTWVMFERQANQMMETLVKSEGRFMMNEFPGGRNNPQLPPDRDIMRSARFFIVRVDDEDEIQFVNVDQIFFVDDDDAEEFAEQVIEKKTSQGRIDRYKFEVKEIDGGKLIFFLDTTRESLTIRTVLLVSGIIAAVSWLIVLVFVVLLSGKVVRPIAEGMEKQKQFITNAGHELKTPLAIIQSNNDAMSLIHGENKYNRNIKDQVVRLSGLTANLLMQAKLDEEVSLPRETVNISELTERIIQPYYASAENRSVLLKSEITPEIVISTNLQAFTQMITILMDNASKYTPNEGEILFSVRREGKKIILFEENTCDQEMTDDPERLFERFYRGDSARTQKETSSGYGIGLSVARSICEALGGRLSAVYPESGKIRFTAVFEK